MPLGTVSGHRPHPRLSVPVLSPPHLLSLPFAPSGLVDHREVYQSLAGGGELLLFKPRWAGGPQSSQLAPLRPLTLDPVSGEATTLTAQTKHIKLFFAMCILCILLGGPTTQSPSRPTCNLQHLSCDQTLSGPRKPSYLWPCILQTKGSYRWNFRQLSGVVWLQVSGGWGGCEPQEPFGKQKGLPKAEINLSSPSSQRAWQPLFPA